MRPICFICGNPAHVGIYTMQGTIVDIDTFQFVIEAWHWIATSAENGPEICKIQVVKYHPCLLNLLSLTIGPDISMGFMGAS
jgi:hypothetical protein